MKMIKHIIYSKFTLAFLFVLFAVQVSIAQEASFTATVSKNRVSVGEQFQISFTVNTSGSNFKAPDFSNFSIYSGPNQSTSMQIVNGNYSQSLSINYILAANREGKFTIGSASINAGGKTLSTKPITIEVVKGNAQARQNNSGSNTGTSAGYPADLESNIFLRASVSKSRVYLGEQIFVSFKVYTRINIVDNSLSKTPSYNGFYAEEISKQRQAELHSEVVDGIQYQVAEIKKTILIPQKSGTLTIDPMEMEIVTRVKSKGRSNNFFDQFFGGGYEDVKLTIANKPIKIEVKPLPEKNKPANFNGAVGQFNIEASINNSELKTDESSNINYTIKGKGNLKLIDAFKLNLPSDIETYDPKISDKINVNDEGIKGSRSFDYLLIPRHAGNFTIPSLNFSYFDPQKEQYVTLPTPEFALKVAKGQGGDGLAVSHGVEKEDVKLVGSDIRYLKTNVPVFISNSSTMFNTGIFWMLFFVPVILYLGFTWWFVRYKKKYSDVAGNRIRKANMVAQKQLKAAKEFLQSNDYNAFFDETFKALYGYIGNKLTLNNADINKDKIKDTLKQKGIEQSLIDRLISIIETCEFARFSPVKTKEKMNETYQESIELISILDSKMKKLL